MATEAAELKAENLVNQYASRIGEAKESFKAIAVKNLAETEAILKQLPLNVAAPVKPEEVVPVKRTAASIMMEIQNKLNNK